MKFSVLLPTRNRLEYLRYAVETVRRQDFEDWEIVISDNCSEDDIRGYVGSLGDARIKYVRTSELVPVTENWNLALETSSGDYVVMLGDDDGLLPGYFSTLLAAMERFPDPDFIYVSALFYAYPNVLPEAPEGLLRRDQSSAFAEAMPHWLSRKHADRIARGYLDFKMPVSSNMQFSLVSRRKIRDLSASGPFFQSPYPDFYATPALFMTSSRILIYPQPLVIIGITPKSYGFFHFNNRAADGAKFLQNEAQLTRDSPVASVMLPGTSYNDSWLLAMEALRQSLGHAHRARPNYRRYRFLQIAHTYKKRYMDGALGRADLKRLQARMTSVERFIYGASLPLGFIVLRHVPKGWRAWLVARLRGFIGQHAMESRPVGSTQFRNLIDVFESFDQRHMLTFAFD
ncbi:MAG TPA: glycosyltransferase family A protein [Caldimonas sp.]|jgi:glycosyltransferase involved in cell wall biosynthesis|nr:glycosyltransferase family A protein [Caldimonas sp.]HEX2542306.1 glycosyltransferase family A protein [Caldimonas sp.]